MTVLSFSVVFHSPFRVGSAYARDGLDAALDQHDPLPPDHLKGLMRDAARSLGLPERQIGEVFGSPKTPSPWSWSSAVPVQDWQFGFRHRVAIDNETHSALKDQLVLGEQAWAESATFEVSQTGLIAPQATARQVLLLRCAASAVHGLGSWRRRGLGWVGITPGDGQLTEAEVTELLRLAQADA
ncbi:MAG TPA: RAMP superfamily CRISPR-associated protein [Streptosporangiaceae bacterium]|nr:RAMP superfamily CRISPR-associated protein [Streptosporangiaceae bacterium]